MAERDLRYLHGDELDVTDGGWVIDSGTTVGTSTVSGRAVLTVSRGASGQGRVARVARATDSVRRLRDRQLMVAQAYVQVVSETSTWAAGSHGVLVSDGVRELAWVAGSAGVALVHPSSGAVLLQVRASTAWSPTARHHVRLTKRGTDNWTVYLDGVQAGRLPYTSAPTTLERARWAFGLLDPASLGAARWDRIEVTHGFDVALPAEVARAARQFPAKVFAELTRAGEAMAQAIAGAMAGPLGRMKELWHEASLSGGDTVARLDADNTSAPDDIRPGWIVTNPANHANVAARWRWTTNIRAQHDLAGLVTPAEIRVAVGATFRRVDFTAVGGSNSTGAMLTAAYGGRIVYARSYVSGTSEYWQMTDGFTPAANTFGHRAYVGSRMPHRVELFLLTGLCALLAIDGVIVHREPWASLAVDASELTHLYAVVGTWDLEDAYSDAVAFDLTRYPLLASRWASRLFWTTGCERNDEVEVWMRRRWQNIAARGTSHGIRQEVARFTCGAGYVDFEELDGGWVLDQTFPDLTPVVLDDADPTLERVTAEIPARTTWTDEQAADYLTHYVLPLSTVALTYRVARQHAMTGSSLLSGSSETLTVDTTFGLQVGDVVELRNAARTVVARATVVSVTSATAVDVAATGISWASGDVLRRIIGTT